MLGPNIIGGNGGGGAAPSATITPHYSTLRAVTGGPVPIGAGGVIQVLVGGERSEEPIAITEGMQPANVASAINDAAGDAPLFVASLDDVTGYLVVTSTVPDALLIVVPPFGDYKTVAAIGLPLEGKHPLIVGGTAGLQGTTDKVVAALDQIDARVDGARAMLLPLQIRTEGFDGSDVPAEMLGTVTGFTGGELLKDSLPGDGNVTFEVRIEGVVAISISDFVDASSTRTIDEFFSIEAAGLTYWLSDDGRISLRFRGAVDQPWINGAYEMRFYLTDAEGDIVPGGLAGLGFADGEDPHAGGYSPPTGVKVQQIAADIKGLNGTPARLEASNDYAVPSEDGMVTLGVPLWTYQMGSVDFPTTTAQSLEDAIEALNTLFGANNVAVVASANGNRLVLTASIPGGFGIESNGSTGGGSAYLGIGSATAYGSDAEGVLPRIAQLEARLAAALMRIEALESP